MFVVEGGFAIKHGEPLRPGRVQFSGWRFSARRRDEIVRDRHPTDVNVRDRLTDYVDRFQSLFVIGRIRAYLEAMEFLVYLDADDSVGSRGGWDGPIRFTRVMHRKDRQ